MHSFVLIIFLVRFSSAFGAEAADFKLVAGNFISGIFTQGIFHLFKRAALNGHTCMAAYTDQPVAVVFPV